MRGLVKLTAGVKNLSRGGGYAGLAGGVPSLRKFGESGLAMGWRGRLNAPSLGVSWEMIPVPADEIDDQPDDPGQDKEGREQDEHPQGPGHDGLGTLDG